jgi:hypothetical protein
MTPAEHGQERWRVEGTTSSGYFIVSDDDQGAKSRLNLWTRLVRASELEAAADRERALEESAAEFEAKYEQAAAEAETLEAERRALVEALREIAHWDYGGQALRCNEMAQAALDRIQSPKTPRDPG